MTKRHLIALAATTALASSAALPTQAAPSLWGLEMISRDYAHEKGFTGAGVVVGVMDEAARYTHQEFADRWLGGFNVDGSPYGPTALHGTHVSGTIAGTRVGVAPGSFIYGINWSADNSDAGYAAGYWWGLHRNVRLFSNSWGLNMIDPVTGDKRSITVADMSQADLEANLSNTLAALFDSAAAGGVQVFATGNDAMYLPGILASLPYYYPDLHPHWIAVTAVGPSGDLASYANMCGVAAAWCIAAPGGDGPGDDGIWSAGPDSDDWYVSIDGTSMATPHVTGAVAIAAEMFQDAAYPQLAQLILQTATDIGTPGIDSVYGWGLLNLRNLVDTIDPRTGSIFAGAAWSRFAAMGHVTQAMRNRIEATGAGDTAAAGIAPLAYDRIAPAGGAFAGGTRASGGSGAWLMPVYGTASMAAGTASAALRNETAGLIGGIDVVADADLQLGLVGGFTHGRLAAAGEDNSVVSDNIHLGAYGRWSAGGWFADGTAQVARFDQSIARGTISGTAGGSLALTGRSHLTGYGAEADLRAGHRFQFAGHGHLSPYAAMTVRWQHAGGTTETGAGMLSLRTLAADHAQLEAGPGLQFESMPVALSNHRLQFVGDISYARLVGDNALHAPVELLGRPIDARGAAVGRDVLRLGARLDLTSDNPSGLNWVAAYDGTFQHRASAHTLAIGARMRF